MKWLILLSLLMVGCSYCGQERVTSDTSDIENDPIAVYATDQIKIHAFLKMENIKDEAHVRYHESFVNYWGDCLYHIYKLKGVDLAAKARYEVINTCEKHQMNLEADRFFAWETSSISGSIEECKQRFKNEISN